MTMSGVAAPLAPAPAQRLRRPSWRDPRLLIGLVLLFTSVAVGARTVALADHTEPVYAARHTLPTGTALSPEGLEIVRVRLAGARSRYLDARYPIPRGKVLIRTVGAGEMLPVASIGPANGLLYRPVAIPIDGSPPAGLAPGGRADIWASAKRRDALGGGYDQPEPIARTVEVFTVDKPGSDLAADRSSSVEVMLPADDLAPVLDALANQARIVILPVPGSVDPS